MIVNIIDSLEKPTVNELVRILNVSQPNISYKINTLVAKGYVRKEQSKKDGREYFLKLTDRYYAYKKIAYGFVDKVLDNLNDKLSREEMDNLRKSLKLIKEEMEFVIKN